LFAVNGRRLPELRHRSMLNERTHDGRAPQQCVHQHAVESFEFWTSRNMCLSFNCIGAETIFSELGFYPVPVVLGLQTKRPPALALGEPGSNAPQSLRW